MPAIIPTNGMIDLGDDEGNDSIDIESDDKKAKKE